VPAVRLVAVAVLAPLLQAYEYAGVPPAPAAVADPSFPPKQLTLEEAVMDEVRGEAGCVMVTLCVPVQPFASVTVSV